MLVFAIVDENVTLDAIPADVSQQMVAGSAEQVADQVKTKVLDAGVDGVIMNIVTHLQGYQPGRITAAAEALKPLVGL